MLILKPLNESVPILKNRNTRSIITDVQTPPALAAVKSSSQSIVMRCAKTGIQMKFKTICHRYV